MKTLTKSSLIICVVISLILTACGASTPVATPTASVTNTAIPPTFTPTITLTPTETPTPTATPDFAATKQYENFFPIVQKLYDDGVISTFNGNYQMMGDYSDQSTAAGTFRWDLYDNKVGEFIIRADIEAGNCSCSSLPIWVWFRIWLWGYQLSRIYFSPTQRFSDLWSWRKTFHY